MNELAQVSIGEGFGSPIGQTITLGNLVSAFLSNAVAIAAVILFILLLFGGVSIVLGAGQNDPQKAARGKQAITAAVVGFVIVFATYWIIQLIELISGIDILRPDYF